MKRFFITLGIAMTIWLATCLIQAFDPNYWSGGIFVAFGNCETTGYPITTCKTSIAHKYTSLVIFLNIFIWFWVIHLFGNWMNKGSK